MSPHRLPQPPASPEILATATNADWNGCGRLQLGSRVASTSVVHAPDAPETGLGPAWGRIDQATRDASRVISDTPARAPPGTRPCRSGVPLEGVVFEAGRSREWNRPALGCENRGGATSLTGR